MISAQTVHILAIGHLRNKTDINEVFALLTRHEITIPVQK
jgi:hypothetical protein